MRKPAFCICENKDADQLRGNREADLRLCFHYTDNTITLLPKSEIFKHLAIFFDYTARFASDRFSHNETHMIWMKSNYADQYARDRRLICIPQSASWFFYSAHTKLLCN